MLRAVPERGVLPIASKAPAKSCWNCGSPVPETHRFCLACGSDTSRPNAGKETLVGKTLVGKYLIQDTLGSGAMGTIYKAEQTALGKTVVIKVLHRHLLTDPELIQRFHREARAASRLNHPNVVQIMDFGSLEDGSLYITMEYIHGIDLATLLEREFPLDHRRLIAIMKQVMMALDEAHANGVLHRDLKPENIMIEDRRTAKDHVKVVDFGIAKLEENNPNSKRSFQTRTGIVCGTPEYMSPEQARGQKLDARSDLYAIGVMLFHMTTDRLPFEAPSPIEVVTKHISEPPVPPRTFRPDLPEALERLILTLLEKDREKRPPSAMDVHAELERIDRELALERRERIAEKTSDDATQVDMRPISQLIEAIDAMGVIGSAAAAAKGSAIQVGVPAGSDARKKSGGQDDTTDQTPREELASNPGAMSLLDTIPEPQGRQLAKQIAEMSRATGTPTPVKPIDTAKPTRGGAAAQAGRVSGESRGAKASKGRSSRDSGGVVSSAKTSGDGNKKGPPDASLVRENITVEARPASEELVAEHEAKQARKSSKGWVLWVVAGLAIAGAVTAVVVLTL